MLCSILSITPAERTPIFWLGGHKVAISFKRSQLNFPDPVHDKNSTVAHCNPQAKSTQL